MKKCCFYFVAFLSALVFALVMQQSVISEPDQRETLTAQQTQDSSQIVESEESTSLYAAYDKKTQ